MHKTRTRASFDMITSELSECAKTAADELIMKIGFPCHYHRPLGQFDNSALYHTARRRARGADVGEVGVEDEGQEGDAGDTEG